jgi:hypothetical protein
LYGYILLLDWHGNYSTPSPIKSYISHSFAHLRFPENIHANCNIHLPSAKNHTMPAPSTPTRRLGKNGPDVPALGFGLMNLSYEAYGSHPSDEERFAILDRAVELGATFWDTAE